MFVDVTVKNGFIDGEPVNLNLNSPKIQTISGIGSPQYESRQMVRTLNDHGFGYKKSESKWVKGYEGFEKTGSTITLDSGFPKSLEGITRIKGNTYEYKKEIKSAGFKWDGATKEWVKK